MAAAKLVDRAHARLLSATKTLATVHKQIKPGLSRVELALLVVPEGRPRLAKRASNLATVPGN